MPTITLSVAIDRSARDVYTFASNPENLPRWSFITEVWREDGAWKARTPEGTTEIRFTCQNDLGVLDHYVRDASGAELYTPMRVFPNARGCEVLVTLLRQKVMSDEDFARDAQIVGRDLAKLKRVLESES